MRAIDADALIEFCEERWIPLNIDAVNMQPTIQPEKEQLSCEGTIISRQWLLECVDEGWIKFDTEEDANRFIHLVRDIAPGVQSVATDTNVGDTISRQAAIDAIDVLCQEHRYRIPGKRETYSEYNEAWQDALDRAEGLIFNLPTVQPERKKGEWLPDNNNAYEMRFVCSCCKESEVVPTIGFTKYKPLWDFCPNCGADMRGEKDG